jgi:hypothetical protein
MRTVHSNHPKKPRPSQSCLTCRHRKVRCTRERPKCSSCMRLNQPCSYELQFYDTVNPPSGSSLLNTATGNYELRETVHAGWIGEEDRLTTERSNDYLYYQSSRKTTAGTGTLPAGNSQTSENEREPTFFGHIHRSHYIGNAFWGFVNGQVSSLCLEAICPSV